MRVLPALFDLISFDECREFDRHSKNIIDECFMKDNELAIGLLECKATAFYNCIPLDVARRANCQMFLSSETVQNYLDHKWYHHFDDQRQVMNMPIAAWVCIASLTFPLLPLAAVVIPSMYKDDAVRLILVRFTRERINELLSVLSII